MHFIIIMTIIMGFKQHFQQYKLNLLYIRWDDDGVLFVLNQQTYLEFWGASSPKQQSAGRHVTPLRPIILIPSQAVFILTL